MKRILILVTLATALFSRANAADPEPRKQVILLKLDDVVAGHLSFAGPVSTRWQRIADYLTANHIKGSFGIIGESLEKDNPAYFKWIKDIQQAGLIEFEKIAAKRDVLALQGHPDQWDDDRWPGFVEIVEFLKSKDVIFMTPSEYLRKTQSN